MLPGCSPPLDVPRMSPGGTAPGNVGTIAVVVAVAALARRHNTTGAIKPRIGE